MARAVLISIRPEWVDKIITGEKTVEIRKTRPNLGTPFKCYIFCTKSGVAMGMWGKHSKKVVGEFVCNRIDTINPATEPYGIYDVDDDFLAQTCLENGALWDYGHGKTLYSWHISNLEIYDTPKELTEFHAFKKCSSCGKSGYESAACIYDENCMVPAVITKAPQSWCYVEELNNG